MITCKHYNSAISQLVFYFSCVSFLRIAIYLEVAKRKGSPSLTSLVPVSAATSLLIIVVGFAASEWEWITEIVGPRLPKWLSKYWKRNDDPNQIESSTQQSEGTPRRIVTMMRNLNYSPV